MANQNDYFKEKKQREKRREEVIERSRLAAWIDGHRKTCTIGGILAAVMIAVLVGAVVYLNVHKYTSYKVLWNADKITTVGTQYECWGDGFIVLDMDGIICYNGKGELQWSAPYDMKDPTAVVQGEYVLIYDRGGKSFVICGRSGTTGKGTTSMEITKGDIAASGVTVLQTEDKEATVMSYYRNDGEQLQVSIRSPLTTTGYPLDVSLSPGGQQLMVSYYYISQGSGNCRICFYDFEKGDESADRVTAEFDYSESGEYIPKVEYLSDSRAYAVGSSSVMFFDASSRTDIIRKTVEVDGKIHKVFNSKEHVGLVVEQAEGCSILVYNADGTLEDNISQERFFDSYAFQDKNVIMNDSENFRVVSFSGRVRFDRTFGNTIYAILPAEKSMEYYMAAMETVQKIKLNK